MLLMPTFYLKKLISDIIENSYKRPTDLNHSPILKINMSSLGKYFELKQTNLPWWRDELVSFTRSQIYPAAITAN